MAYVVFEDLETKSYITKPADAPVKIHRVTCRFYTGRKPDATTVRWSDTFESIGDAEHFARLTGRTWARALCCP